MFPDFQIATSTRSKWSTESVL